MNRQKSNFSDLSNKEDDVSYLIEEDGEQQEAAVTVVSCPTSPFVGSPPTPMSSTSIAARAPPAKKKKPNYESDAESQAFLKLSSAVTSMVASDATCKDETAQNFAKFVESSITAGTVRTNRFKDPPLPDQKALSKRGRGSSSECYSDNAKVIFTRWFDNKVVNLASNFVGIGTSDMAKRWDKNTSKYIEVNRPKFVRLYNENMSGLDLLDQMLQYYRINIRTSKWTVRVIMHFVDLALTASWMEYKKACEVHEVPKKERKKANLISLNVRAEVANVLVKLQKRTNDIDVPRRGRPSRTPSCPATQETFTPESEDCNPFKSKKTNQSAPAKEVRLDGYNHIPEFLENSNVGRCKMAGCTKKTFILCKKCNVYLCVKHGSNCFADYHTK